VHPNTVQSIERLGTMLEALDRHATEP
jgi:hypothetical protein